jgi:hypothetical protein
MPRIFKVQHFDSEGRENLRYVIKNVKNYLRAILNNGESPLPKLVFLTGQGEGPMIAYNELNGLDVKMIAVTFPRGFHVKVNENEVFYPQIPERVRKFFSGVEIPIITGRLPFDSMSEADAHNREMAFLRSALALFGGSMPLAIQAVLQATDSGLVKTGEEVIAVTSDTAVLITASTSDLFLNKNCGMMVNEIICKPRNFTISRRMQSVSRGKELSTRTIEAVPAKQMPEDTGS